MTKVATTIDLLYEELEEAQEDLLEEAETYTIVVCRGSPRCDYVPPLDANGDPDLSEFEACAFCYRFASDDQRSTDDIMDDIERFH
jgi:hypothetical protein